MATTFSPPRLLKGALVSFTPPDPTPRAIIFQFNPGTLSRTLEAQFQEESGKSGDPPRLKGAPVETLKLEIDIDAADQLGDERTAETGILPQLAALELLIYPPSQGIITNNTLLRLGTIEIIPSAAQLTLFVWGKRRILPVRVTEFSVTEDAHQPNLSPIRAKVSLGLRVLSYSDVSSENLAWGLFMAHQVTKESLAAGAVSSDVSLALGSNVRLV